MESKNSYSSRLESITRLEDGGEIKKAKFARFSLLESFAGLRHRFTCAEEDFECLRVYVEVLVTLLRCRTNALEEFWKMIPIVREIIPLMRSLFFKESGVLGVYMGDDKRDGIWYGVGEVGYGVGGAWNEDWGRYLDEEEHKSLITSLTTQLGSCTVFLVSEHARFDEKLACDYCVLSFSELGEWLMTDQLAEFGQKICNKVCEHLNECNLAILQCVLQCMAQICKNQEGKFLTEFINLVGYVVKKCPVSESSVKVASIFKNLVEAYFSEVQELPLNPILSIYSVALCVTKVEKDLVKMDEGLKALNSIHLASQTTYAHLFFMAFKLLLLPVFTLILIRHVDILAKSIELPITRNVLEQFRELCCIYRKSETQKDIYEENNMVIVPIAVSLCTLKLATREDTKVQCFRSCNITITIATFCYIRVVDFYKCGWRSNVYNNP
ncbi:separase [Tanacetum coccineum]